MEKNMEATIMGYIGNTIRMHSRTEGKNNQDASGFFPPK